MVQLRLVLLVFHRFLFIILCRQTANACSPIYVNTNNVISMLVEALGVFKILKSICLIWLVLNFYFKNLLWHVMLCQPPTFAITLLCLVTKKLSLKSLFYCLLLAAHCSYWYFPWSWYILWFCQFYQSKTQIYLVCFSIDEILLNSCTFQRLCSRFFSFIHCTDFEVVLLDSEIFAEIISGVFCLR